MKAECESLFDLGMSDSLPTFDQIVEKYHGEISGKDLGPNYREDAELVIEPVAGGVNVTVRDLNHNTLVSFIAGRSGTTDMTAQVALLARMRMLVKSRLEKAAGNPPEVSKETALEAVDAFERDVVAKLRESLNTKKETSATRMRAAAAIDSLRDARRIIDERMNAVRGAEAGQDK